MATGITRLGKHLMLNRWRVRQAFSPAALARIEAAIKSSEQQHAGQIRFVVEGSLDSLPLLSGQSARERAIDLFSLLRVWDTEHNSGVLIYLLLADRDVEIVADRGINARVGSERWHSICKKMEGEFRLGRFEQGVMRGIDAITVFLAEHFPPDGTHRNELPDTPVIL